MHVSILGTRGVPSNHSGFETFAQDFALFLLSRGHQVTVYCQLEENEAPQEDTWNGIRRVSLPAGKGPVGTMAFDWKAIKHSMRDNSVILTLGYNTGVFNLLYRFSGIPNIMNMDGLEWKREKWSGPAKAWFWLNEWAGARADSPGSYGIARNHCYRAAAVGGFAEGADQHGCHHRRDHGEAR